MRRPDLVADCASCAAICCTATSFAACEDFAFDKPAGVACGHLRRDGRCAIHDELAVRGFAGCAVYDCYGAGPRVTRAFAGVRGDKRRRDAAFLALRVVHELLWLLTEAAKLCPASPPELREQLAAQIEALDAIACTPDALVELDLARLDRSTRILLTCVGGAVGGRRAARRVLSVLRSEP
jgi:hypothetical protein